MPFPQAFEALSRPTAGPVRQEAVLRADGRPRRVVLISTYELGRQPFEIASAAAWLRRAGAAVACNDLAVEPPDVAALAGADLVAFSVPMHTATRLAVAAVERVKALNPTAHVCFFGRYAPANEAFLRGLGAQTILGGEFEPGLVALAARLATQQVPFQVQHHPLTINAQQPAASEHIPGRTLAKVVMILADGRLVLLALPAPARVDLAKAGTLLGVTDVRLAQEQEFASAFPDCEVGAMPPFGNLYDLQVYVDEVLAENETIDFPAGTHIDTMSVRYAGCARLANPTVAEVRHT